MSRSNFENLSVGDYRHFDFGLDFDFDVQAAVPAIRSNFEHLVDEGGDEGRTTGKN